MELHQESIDIIKELQFNNGGFPSYPHYSVFNYSILSEGTFCAYALDIWEEHKAAREFYVWATKRFVTESDLVTENDYQIDGYGTLLWGLGKHLVGKSQSELMYFEEAAIITQRFLIDAWKSINNSEHLHTATLACLYGGLFSINAIYPHDEVPAILENIKAILKYDFTKDGHFIKNKKDNIIDLKLLFLAYPFNVFNLKDPIMNSTYKSIKDKFIKIKDLAGKYASEENSEWLTLTALLGCSALLEYDYKFAEKIFVWMQEQANFAGYFQELVPKKLIYPAVFYETIDRWGQNEKPLLIHHALYLILEKELKKFIKS